MCGLLLGLMTVRYWRAAVKFLSNSPRRADTLCAGSDHIETYDLADDSNCACEAARFRRSRRLGCVRLALPATRHQLRARHGPATGRCGRRGAGDDARVRGGVSFG